MVTLGIYRFWLATDVRRFLWSNTEIDGNTLEYNGLAFELLIGFLFAIALMVPIYSLFSLARSTLARSSGRVLGFPLLALLGHFAVYRAGAIASPAPCSAACASTSAARRVATRSSRSSGGC